LLLKKQGAEQASPVENLQALPEYESIIYGTHGYVLWGIVFVAIAFFGCIGNVLTIIVLKSEPVISTLNVLLIALAISDILAPQANALLAIAFYHLEATYGNSVNYLVFSDILRHIIQPLGTMFTMISSWIVTTTTLFRLIAVMFPFKARTLINRRCAVISLVIILSFSLAFILPIYLSLIRRTKCTRDGKQLYEAFEMHVTSEFMMKAYMPMIQTMCFYLPWLIALTLWLFLLRTLRQSEKNFNISFVSKDSSIIVASAPLMQPTAPHHHNQNNHRVLHVAKAGSSSVDYRMSTRKSHSHQKCAADDSLRLHQHQHGVNHSSSVILNSESRISNVETRQKSYNKITLMVVVLCFTNLICRVFTFVFIFESFYDSYAMSRFEATAENSNSQQVDTARTQFPKFMSYSLLLNNICMFNF
jgi:hypothetical protein